MSGPASSPRRPPAPPPTARVGLIVPLRSGHGDPPRGRRAGPEHLLAAGRLGPRRPTPLPGDEGAPPGAEVRRQGSGSGGDCTDGGDGGGGGAGTGGGGGKP